MRTTNAACTFIVALALGAAFGAPAIAAEPPEPPITNPSAVVDNITPEMLTELMRELGAQQIVTSAAPDGTKVVTFFDGGMPYNLSVALCDIRPGKCIAVTMFVMLDPGTKNFPLEVFNTHNRQTLFVSMAKLDGNKFGVGRVLLSDGGITKKNLAINIASFVLAVQGSLKYLSSQMVASYQQNGTLQLATSDTPPRAVAAPLEDLALMAKALSKTYQTTLSPQK